MRSHLHLRNPDRHRHASEPGSIPYKAGAERREAEEQVMGIAAAGEGVYALATYGWFMGLGLGWIPSIFIAVLIALAIAVALLDHF
jgi:hypothetical protein